MQAASYICIAHDIVVTSEFALFATHNDFQAPSAEDRTGLIPRWTGAVPSYIHTWHAFKPPCDTHNVRLYMRKRMCELQGAR